MCQVSRKFIANLTNSIKDTFIKLIDYKTIQVISLKLYHVSIIGGCDEY